MGFEENEISIKSNGGTELSKRSIANHLPQELLENFQIIASRPRELHDDKIRIFYAHDLPDDPEVEKLKYESERNKYHKFVFVSNWQLNEYHKYLGIPLDDKVQVIENPIGPSVCKSKSFEDKIRLVYFSTPQRGLEILLPVFEKLCEKQDNLHLDVFSSFKIYGWEEMDKKYQPLYDKLNNHPNIDYYGYVENEKLQSCLHNSHILAYPSIWQETSCRVLIESMSAGLLCVHPNLAALSETSGGLTVQYQFYSDPNNHSNQLYKYLDHAISIVSKDEVQKYLKFVKSYADTKYNVNKISTLWQGVLEDLLIKYSSKESRAIQQSSHMFRYSA